VMPQVRGAHLPPVSEEDTSRSIVLRDVYLTAITRPGALRLGRAGVETQVVHLPRPTNCYLFPTDIENPGG